MDHLIMRRVLLAGLVVALSGCGDFISNKLADTLSAPGKTYARDDDPELVKGAIPFILKTMEQIHESVPKHRALSEALARTCTQFAVGFVGEEADRLAEKDMATAQELYQREKKLALRGFRYGLDGLQVALPGSCPIFESGTREQREQILKGAKKEDVGLLYWTAAALGSAISADKNDLKWVGQLPLVEQMMHRALELDASWEDGSLHEFYITWYAAHGKGDGGGPDLARKEMEKARSLDGNKKLAPIVTFAEAVDVDTQNKVEFTKLLEQATAFDVDSAPDFRLANVIAQRRARWLLTRTADLFVE
jgi:predicted anti-sigma-YlaC factor YlaD